MSPADTKRDRVSPPAASAYVFPGRPAMPNQDPTSTPKLTGSVAPLSPRDRNILRQPVSLRIRISVVRQALMEAAVRERHKLAESRRSKSKVASARLASSPRSPRAPASPRRALGRSQRSPTTHRWTPETFQRWADVHSPNWAEFRVRRDQVLRAARSPVYPIARARLGRRNAIVHSPGNAAQIARSLAPHVIHAPAVFHLAPAPSTRQPHRRHSLSLPTDPKTNPLLTRRIGLGFLQPPTSCPMVRKPFATLSLPPISALHNVLATDALLRHRDPRTSTRKAPETTLERGLMLRGMIEMVNTNLGGRRGKVVSRLSLKK